MKTDLQYPLFNVSYFIRGEGSGEQLFLGRKRESEKAVRMGVANMLLGFGGGFDSNIDTSVVAGICREHSEEDDGCVILPENVEHRARILVRNVVRPPLYLDYALIRKWQGAPSFNATEFTGSGWYGANPLPKDVMALDRIVLPLVLSGKIVSGTALYAGDMKSLVEYDIKEVESLE